MNPTLVRIALAVRILVALVLLQTLFFKFTGAAESVAIFTKLGMEPYGRIGSGIAEAIASVLLLMRTDRWIALGALQSIAVITGAILSHLTVLGIEVEGDGGLLFALALVVFFGSGFVLFVHRHGLAPWLAKLRPSSAAQSSSTR
ncbi:MAG: DoxX family protein [Planctomycetota bacterium]